MAKSFKPIDKVSLELLSPAGNLATGLVALSAGADAVYIGAPRFGARVAAGVSLEDIALLVGKAHLVGAKVYVALNTILYENDLQEAEKIAKALYYLGVDALIIQDFALLALDLPPIPLHASTQCHNHDVESLVRLEALGFEQAVLARELNVAETADIASHLSRLRLETFVHGALCVSYSGRCYLSQAFRGRSANRGECAQLCRLPYQLFDASGTLVRDSQYILSLKDLNRSKIIPDLIRAGVSSFKIEGRLKSASYVANVTAYYRQVIDSFIAQDPEHYKRSSLGEHRFLFTPNPFKTFSRGATSYQLQRGNLLKESLIRPESPKSEGEALAQVQTVRGNKIILEKPLSLSNGDGVCFYTKEKTMKGGRVNRVLGEREFAFLGKTLPEKGTLLYRNYDIAFEKQLANPKAAERIIPVEVQLKASSSMLRLTLSLLENHRLFTTVAIGVHLEKAKNPTLKSRLVDSISKLGTSLFESQHCLLQVDDYFVPLSLVSDLKRKAVSALERVLRIQNLAKPLYRPQLSSFSKTPLFSKRLSYEQNVSNSTAEKVFRQLGANVIDPAFELKERGGEMLMTTKYCIRRELGYCTLSRRPFPFQEPLCLTYEDIKVRLQFDCKNCQMLLFRIP